MVSTNEISEAVVDAVCEVEAVADSDEHITYEYSFHFDDANIVKAILATAHDGAGDWIEDRLWNAIGSDLESEFEFVEIMTIAADALVIKGTADCWMEG